MRIVVLHGSPKGEVSVTMQYVRYLEEHFPEHEFKVFPVAQRIGLLEKDEGSFREIIDEVRSADGVIWSFPLYVLTVCSQYMRFIELVFERGAEDAFRGKYAAALSTSIHFFDHTAHNYIHSVAEDLGMIFVSSFSADMRDLLEEKGRSQLVAFGGNFLTAIGGRRSFSRAFEEIRTSDFAYFPSEHEKTISPGGSRLVLLHDAREEDRNLRNMIDHFTSSLDGGCEVYSLHEIDMKGGCLGCCRCGYDNRCVYEGGDGFSDFYRDVLMNADILVFAGTIGKRFLSSRWKMFFDRTFFKTHQPWFVGRQMAYLLSGPLGQIQNLREIFLAYGEISEANLVDIVTDECGDSGELDRLLEDLAERAVEASLQGASMPLTFRGVGGRKIFRDDIWGRLRFVFHADHRYYRDHGFYDFPQRNWRTRIFNVLVTPLVHIPAVRRRIFDDMQEKMIRPYRKVLGKRR